MGTAASVAQEQCGGMSHSSSGKVNSSKELYEKFKSAVYTAAGVAQCDVSDQSKVQLKLKAFIESVDSNHDGMIDAEELEVMMSKLDLNFDKKTKDELTHRLQEVLLAADDSSLDMVLNMFAEPLRCEMPLQSNEPKRVAFIGGTGAGKSLLCTVLTGQDEDETAFEVGDTSSSQTLVCSKGQYHWFGEDTQEEFICIDTPGLNDEMGRDEQHINTIIEELKKLEYVNAIVFVCNGQDQRFSSSLQKMIQAFEKAFSHRFYNHTIIALTRWYMDPISIKQRMKKKPSRTEQLVAEELNQKMRLSPHLCCRTSLPVLFVDSLYEDRDPDDGRAKLEKLRDTIGSNVFRTADLQSIKPKIKMLTNVDQQMKTGTNMSSMTVILMDKEVNITKWECEPLLPEGLGLEDGIITGKPVGVSAKRPYSLFATSIGGRSEACTFELEIMHSAQDIKNIVSKYVDEVTNTMIVALPMDAGSLPDDDATTKAVLAEATTQASLILDKANKEITLEHSGVSTCTEILNSLKVECERAMVDTELVFLSACSQAISRGREVDQASTTLNMLLVKQSEDVGSLKRAIENCRRMECKESLILAGEAWLEQILPSPCRHSDKGCSVIEVKKDLAHHEAQCVFGLPLRGKQSLTYSAPSPGTIPKDETTLELLVGESSKSGGGSGSGGGSEEEKRAAGTYELAAHYCKFDYERRSLYTIKPVEEDAKAGPTAKNHRHGCTLGQTPGRRASRASCDVCGGGFTPGTSFCCDSCDWDICGTCFKLDEEAGKATKYPPQEFEWGVFVQTQQDGPLTEVVKSTNKVGSPYKAVFPNCTVQGVGVYQWKDPAEEARLNADSLKLLYFGGQWCPYCPPFTKVLKMFYDSIVRQKGREAIDLVFVSSDQTAKAMTDYYTGHHGDWLTVPYEERGVKEVLSNYYEVKGIPTACLINNKSEDLSEAIGTVRTALQSLGDEPGERMDAQALTIFNNMQMEVEKSMVVKKSAAVSSDACQIFMSLRYAEAYDQAKVIRDILQDKHGLRVFICETEVGDNIFDEIMHHIDGCKMVIILGSKTYGQETASNFSTKQELEFVLQEKKPFYLIKMCGRFEVSKTRFLLNDSISYERWLPDEPMNDLLIGKIVSKFEKACGGV